MNKFINLIKVAKSSIHLNLNIDDILKLPKES